MRLELLNVFMSRAERAKILPKDTQTASEIDETTETSIAADRQSVAGQREEPLQHFVPTKQLERVFPEAKTLLAIFDILVRLSLSSSVILLSLQPITFEIRSGKFLLYQCAT